MGFGLILFIVTFAGTLLVQMWLKSTYGKWSRVQNASSLSGAETARAILDANGLRDVPVEAVQGQLTDHYDPSKRVVRLSEANYRGASVAGMAVAAHEVGHAIQHAKAYAPLQWRAALVPVAGIGANFGPWLVFGGFMLGMNENLILVGLALFAAAVLFQVVTLPVEFDASRRAMAQLSSMGLVTSQDSGGARAVLSAAAMTYVAAMAASLAYLLYYLSIFLGNRE
ncbi:MAG: zinc metallopeptidase [Deinococcota bacterium]|jgi:Zn-dependent membrane protease YugP|nr:zinc metallopeptidase [Deinococcota bacterium]